MDPLGNIWMRVIEATGQTLSMKNQQGHSSFTAIKKLAVIHFRCIHAAILFMEGFHVQRV